MKVGLVSDQDWRAGVGRARAAGAEMICLPHLSFAPYVAAQRDRSGLESAERPTSPSLLEAIGLADGAWLSASAYESEGEGVFYVSSYLAGPDGPAGRYRQAKVVAEAGRWEQMFFAPGHEGNEVVATPLGRTATLVGSDVRSPGAWDEVAAAGVEIVVCGVSDIEDEWPTTRNAVSGLAAAHGLRALLVNRAGTSNGLDFPGGAVAFDAAGAEAGVGEIVEVGTG